MNVLNDCWFIFENDYLLINQDQEQSIIPQQVNSLKSFFIRQYPIGKLNSFNCFCAEINAGHILPDHLTRLPLKKALNLLDSEWFPIAAKAFSIINWDKTHQYCGRCGNQTTFQAKNFERICTHCHLIFYPRISPCVIVLIKKNDHLLMARSPHFAPGIFGLIAGFVEPGETLESAVHREVKEEVGIVIKNLKYFGSQSWPFPDSLMIAFTADYDSGELINSEEIETADWYKFDNLPGLPSVSVSIGRLLINLFVAEQHSKLKDS